MGVLPGDHGPRFGFKCPICTHGYYARLEVVKHFMASFTVGHTKDMLCCCDRDCGKVYSVRHHACSGGCYKCVESYLELELTSVHGHEIESAPFLIC